MSNAEQDDATWLHLYDWRRRVADMYRERDATLRAGDEPARTAARFRETKDALFAGHPQSPIAPEERNSFAGLSYFPYDKRYAIEAKMEPPSEGEQDGAARPNGLETLPMRRAATLRFELDGQQLALAVYWIDVYGGSLFVPFVDATCPAQSYGGGRYLIDTAKGSDFPGRERGDEAMGFAGGHVIVDFNYAYNPSCAYDIRWACPLAPRENHLPIAIRAGERKYHD